MLCLRFEIVNKSIPPNLVIAVQECLKDVFEGGYYADKVLAHKFRHNRQWGKRDRQFIAETVYDMTRWWRRLAVMDGQSWIPADYGLRLQKYSEFKNQRGAEQNETPSETESPAVNESFPDWFVEQLFADYSVAEGQAILRALNQVAPVYLRPNFLKIDLQKLKDELGKEGVETEIVESPPALKLLERKNVFATQSFKSGFFEVQDLASQRVGILLDPQAGERVADVCAGAGGKTLHLATLMQNKGTLLAGDVHEKKIEELKVRAKRAGVSNLRAVIFENSKDVKKHFGKFDALLIDAPCSGSGVIRRNPDSKWKIKKEDLIRIGLEQAEILKLYSQFLKPGGRMVYATCSIFKSENEGQVAQFLERNSEFSLKKQIKILPHMADEDGFYMALLEKGKS